MRNLKKFLALVLAMMMAFSLMVTVNAASDFTDKSDITDDFSEAVAVLKGMGVFEGYEDGSFKPQTNISRAEVAAIVYRLATGDAKGDQVHLYADYQKFDDVKTNHWAAGYINYCANAEWIAGYGNGNFGPSDNVTGYQAAAMILRAVGYGKNGEFKGPTWQVQVANVARSKDLLTNVNKTTYANTLNSAATRELVAEILFQAAQIPTVTWTMLNGYNEYPVVLPSEDTKKNDSLGVKNFGLTDYTGIIVGNQETGELTTRIAMTGNKIPYVDENGKAAEYPIAAKFAYSYPGTGVEQADLTAAGCPEFASGGNNADGTGIVTVSLNLDAETGLDLYGHKVKAWYNGKSHAYAVIDQAKSATVYAGADTAANELKIGKTDTTGIAKAAAAAGFKMSKVTAAADMQWSLEYGQFGKDADFTTNASPIHMYTLIDNDGDGGIDAIIRLNAEVAKITKTDTTAKPQTIELKTTASGNGNKKDSLFTNGTAGILTSSGDDNQILPNSVTKLGEVVTVWQVKGGTAFADAAAAVANTDLFLLAQDFTEVTGTVTSYKASGGKVVSVNLSNGTTIERSGILEGSKAIAYYTDGGVASLSAGVSYTFKLDKLGRFVNISSPDAFKFFYGTYADFQYGTMGTGEINYKVYGVDWDGKNVNDRDLTSMKVGSAPTEYGPSQSDAAKQLGNGYASNDFAITKKNMSTNSVTPGKNMAFMLNDKGRLVQGATDGSVQLLNSTETDATKWVITSGNAANGFATVASKGVDYMLTNDTVFYVVTGFGVNANVKVYTGLKELLGSGTSVEISYAGTSATAGATDEVWFQTGDYKYDSVETGKNKTITKVILSDTNLRSYDAANLYYADAQVAATGDSGMQLTDLPAGISTVKHVRLWNNGEAANYFLDVTATTGGADPAANKFYTLTKVGEGNGMPIYKAIEITADTTPKMATMANGGACNVDLKYEYVVVNNYNKASIGATGAGEIFDVGNAKVADVQFNTTTVTNRNEIDTLQKLNNAVSVYGTNKITVAIVNDGINASVIYVTAVELS